MAEIVSTALGQCCADCPDLDNDAERPADPSWRPRARCCRDEHVDRRAAGDDRDWEGIERGREISDADAEAGITPRPHVWPHESRQGRRQRERKAKP